MGEIDLKSICTVKKEAMYIHRREISFTFDNNIKLSKFFVSEKLEAK